MFFEPFLNFSSFVGAAIIKNDMQVKLFGRCPFELAHEIKELFGAVAISHSTDHLACQDIKCCIEACNSVPLVIMGPALDLTWLKL